jgi:hypothetical protein
LTGEAAETASESQPVNVSEELPQGPADQTNNIGQEASYEAGRVQDYIVLPTDEIVDSKPLGPEAEVVTDGIPEDEAGKAKKGNVCSNKSDTPGPQLWDHQVTPAISVERPGTPVLDTSTVPAECGHRHDSVDITPQPTELSTPETPVPQPATAPLPQPWQQQPPVAPVPDLNKLFSAPTQTNLRGDDGPSSITAEHIHSAPPPPTLKTTTPTSTSTSTSARRPQTAKKPPQTPIASYLGVGLRESRLVEVGLRGALGDVRARARARANANMRRLSLPPQHMLDRETMDALSAAGPASAPASDAGDGDHGLSSSLSSLSLSELGLRLGRWWEGDRDRDGGRGEDVNVDGAGVTGVRDVDGDGDGDGEGGAVPVLPRMMLLLATAMAVGKIMKSAAE